MSITFISKTIQTPEEFSNAMRIPTGETITVYTPIYQTYITDNVLPLLECRQVGGTIEYLVKNSGSIIKRTLPEGYILTNSFPIHNEEGEIINFKLRFRYPEEVEAVTGGYQMTEYQSFGDLNTYKVTCAENAIKAIHAHTVELNDGAGGAIAILEDVEYPVLPSIGEPVKAGTIYTYNGDLVIARTDGTLATDLPTASPELFAIYAMGQDNIIEWSAGELVLIGMLREYNNTLFRCLIEHITQSDWTPPIVPNLWVEVIIASEDPEPWVQPDSTNPYMIGDKVLFNGLVYESIINNNVWSPAAYPAGWLLIP